MGVALFPAVSVSKSCCLYVRVQGQCESGDGYPGKCELESLLGCQISCNC